MRNEDSYRKKKLRILGYLDMTPLGRQEKWEQAPPAVKVKQTDTYEWWRHHDRYKNE
ncbi:DUF899 family protein [Shouchella sp. 1P09AA]|uniref:hypothetical protein n=1 Tax=unclassified Shouchella TaxID=2893065 RepID=UPI0039A15CBF